MVSIASSVYSVNSLQAFQTMQGQHRDDLMEEANRTLLHQQSLGKFSSIDADWLKDHKELLDIFIQNPEHPTVMEHIVEPEFQPMQVCQAESSPHLNLSSATHNFPEFGSTQFYGHPNFDEPFTTLKVEDLNIEMPSLSTTLASESAIETPMQQASKNSGMQIPHSSPRHARRSGSNPLPGQSSESGTRRLHGRMVPEVSLAARADTLGATSLQSGGVRRHEVPSAVISQSMEVSQSSVSDEQTAGLESSEAPPQKKGPGRKKRTEPILVETEDGEVKYVSPTEFRKLRRRITNRMSARRMRKKHADEKVQTKTQQMSMEAELEQCKESNEKLTQSLIEAKDFIATLEAENRNMRMIFAKMGIQNWQIDSISAQNTSQSLQAYPLGQRNTSLSLQSSDVMPSPRHSSRSTEYPPPIVQPVYSQPNPFLQPSLSPEIRPYNLPQTTAQDLMEYPQMSEFQDLMPLQYQGQTYQQERQQSSNQPIYPGRQIQ